MCTSSILSCGGIAPLDIDSVSSCVGDNPLSDNPYADIYSLAFTKWLENLDANIISSTFLSFLLPVGLPTIIYLSDPLCSTFF